MSGSCDCVGYLQHASIVLPIFSDKYIINEYFTQTILFDIMISFEVIHGYWINLNNFMIIQSIKFKNYPKD